MRLTKGVWTEEEDRLLKSHVDCYGPNWALIAQMIPTRSAERTFRETLVNRVTGTDDVFVHKSALSGGSIALIPGWIIADGLKKMQVSSHFLCF